MTWPFENDTSGVERTFAARSLTAHKQRNLLTGIILFAASLLLSFSAILICNATLHTQIISRVDNSTEMIRVLSGIAVVLLLTAGIAIQNIMYISVLQRTRQFAQLRTIGATSRQIRAMIHRERKQLSWNYIPIGLFAGLLCNMLLPLQLYWIPSIICTLLAGAFVWFLVFLSFRVPAEMAASLSPLAAFRSDNGPLTKRTRRNTRITPHSLAKLYLSSNRRKAGYTLLSLTLSGALMLTVLSILSAVDIETFVRQSYDENSSVSLILNSTADENSTYDLMRHTPFTESLREEILSIPGVTTIYPSKLLKYCQIAAPDTPNREPIEWTLNSIVGVSEFESSLMEGEMPYQPHERSAIPVVINRGSPYYESASLDLRLGDLISASIDTGDSIQDVTFSVCGIIENKDSGGVLYTSPEVMDALAEMNCDLAWFICTDENKTESAVSQIRSLVSSDRRLVMNVFADDLAEYQSIFQNAKTAALAFTVLISLFSFINLLNTCITNIIMRNRDYALLEAAGMTKAQLLQMQHAENRIYFLCSLLGSCLAGIPLGLLLCQKIAQIPGLSYISYHFPWTFVVFYAIFVFAVHVMVNGYQRQLLMAQSVAERVRVGD